MRKIGYMVAGVLSLAIVAPQLAKAETTVIERGRSHGPYAEMRMHRDYGWHRGWHRDHDRVVIVRRHHHHEW